MENEIQRFNQCVKALEESKFLVTSKAISELLRTVTNITAFTDSLGMTMKTFNYSSEFERARIPIASGNESALALPNGTENLFAFVLCLLAEFDSGKRDMVQFLAEFYGGKEPQIAFNEFCDKIIKPFAIAANKIYIIYGKEKASAISLENQGYFFDSSAGFDENEKKEIRESAQKLKNARSRADKEEKVELAAMVDALCEAVDADNAILIGLIYTGIKFAVKALKINGNAVIGIETALKSKNLI